MCLVCVQCVCVIMVIFRCVFSVCVMISLRSSGVCSVCVCDDIMVIFRCVFSVCVIMGVFRCIQCVCDQGAHM